MGKERNRDYQFNHASSILETSENSPVWGWGCVACQGTRCLWAFLQTGLSTLPTKRVRPATHLVFLSQFREAQGCLSAFLMGGQRTLTWFLTTGLASTLAGKESRAFWGDSDGGPEPCFSLLPTRGPFPNHSNLLISPFFKTLQDLLSVCLKITFLISGIHLLFNSLIAQ